MRRTLLYTLTGLMLSALNPQINFAQTEPSPWKSALSDESKLKIANEQKIFSVDLNSLRVKIAACAQNKVPMSFPLGAGPEIQFLIQSNEVLVPSLAALNPEIKTYEGFSLDHRAQIRVTTSPFGINAKISVKGAGTYYIQSVNKEQANVLISYSTQSLIDNGERTACGLDEEAALQFEDVPTAAVAGKTCALRTYVLAVAATGEYTAWAGSQAQALAKITETVNNVNMTYERDMGIRFTLNSPNSILYTDANTDPYSSASLSSTILNQNQSAITVALTSAGFDLGHVFNAGWSGGLAQLSSVCDNGAKARAASGLSTAFPMGPSGPIFENTVAHEIAHQLSAHHTFSANNGGCNGNTNNATAWEPGGGSTIMAYAGTCTGNNYQFYSDDYFHAGSLIQMSNFVTSSIPTCGTTNASLGNVNPTTSVVQDAYTIPASTPFMLTLNAADATHGGLTYTWEQLNPLSASGNTGTASSPSPTATSGAQFRSYMPDAEHTKYFPRLESIATGNLTYEVLPSVNRTMTFRGVARDNFAGVGCFSAQDVTVTTNNACNFNITSHTVPTSLVADGSNTTTLTWNTASCVTCTNVSIRFSTDGGRTFPHLLANTANDGSEALVVPNLPTCKGRFMVACADNIFFNINTADINITNSACLANGGTIAPSTDVAENLGSPNLNLSMAPQYGSALAINGTINTTDLQGQLVLRNIVNNSCVVFGNTTYNDTFSFYVTQSGTYTFTGSGDYAMMFHLYEGSFNNAAQCTNLLASTGEYNGSYYSTANKTFSVDLCPGTKYILVANAVSNNAIYNMSVSGPGTIMTNPSVSPGAGYQYKYVVVGSNNVIKAVINTPDLSNGAVFGDDTYKVFGLSTENYSDWSAWIGANFESMQMMSANQNGWCFNLSANYRTIVVGSGVPMPLKDLKLSAFMKQKGLVQIDWSVKEEKDILQYELERSYDGLTFEKIFTEHKVRGGDADYQYQDAGFMLNNTLYYRLKAKGIDGGYEVSPIVKVTQTDGNIGQIQIIPNPIQSNRIVANITVAEGGNYEMSLLDLTGRILKTEIVPIQKGNYNYSISASGLQAGMYILRVTNNRSNTQVKFVVE
jgi:hypothetical protein